MKQLLRFNKNLKKKLENSKKTNKLNFVLEKLYTENSETHNLVGLLRAVPS